MIGTFSSTYVIDNYKSYVYFLYTIILRVRHTRRILVVFGEESLNKPNQKQIAIQAFIYYNESVPFTNGIDLNNLPKIHNCRQYGVKAFYFC